VQGAKYNEDVIRIHDSSAENKQVR
jgi:hypothetical protein